MASVLCLSSIHSTWNWRLAALSFCVYLPGSEISIETVPVMYYSCTWNWRPMAHSNSTCSPRPMESLWSLLKTDGSQNRCLLGWNIDFDQPGTYLELTYVGIQVPGIYVTGIYVLSGSELLGGGCNKQEGRGWINRPFWTGWQDRGRSFAHRKYNPRTGAYNFKIPRRKLLWTCSRVILPRAFGTLG